MWFVASILRADMKYGKKHFSAVDENRRDTYKQFHPSTSSSNESYLWNSLGDRKRLLPVCSSENLYIILRVYFCVFVEDLESPI